MYQRNDWQKPGDKLAILAISWRMTTSSFPLSQSSFKDTPLGPLPEEWEVSTVGELANKGVLWLKNGYAQGEHNQESRGVPHIRPFNISSSGRITLSQVKYVPRPLIKTSPYWLLPGDVIFNNTNSEELVGKTAYFDLDGEYVLSNHMTILRLSKDSGVDAYWLALQLHYRWLRGELQSLCRRHVNQASISLDRFQGVNIPIPPFPEQRAIARVLSTVRQAIEASERVVAALYEFKRSLMQHLFTYGSVTVDDAARMRIEELLKESEVGEVPDEWEVVKLGDISAIGNGSTPKRDNPSYWVDGNIPWLTSSKVHDGIIYHADEFVTHLARKECHLPMIPKKSVVVAITGQGKTLGNAALVMFDTCMSQHLAYITLENDQLYPEFVLVYLQYRYQDFRRLGQAGGTTKGALTCGLLKSYPIPKPPIKEQVLISNSLMALDSKLRAEEQRKAALEELFRSLLGELMTGRLRVSGQGNG